jgi:hypothetical protein
MYWVNPDGSINPVGDMMRVWAEELAGTSFASAYNFGADANNIYIGSLFTGPGKSVAAFSAPGTPNGQIFLAVSGGGWLHVISPFGAATDIPVINGVATLNIGNTPSYVELAAGQTINLIPFNWGADLALQPGVSATASGTGVSPLGPNIPNATSKIYNGQIESWYWSQQSGSDIWMDNTSGLPAWVQINLPTAQTVSRIVIYSGVPWQLRGSLLDFDVQVLVNGSWTTVQTISDDPKTFAAYSPETQTTVDSFYDEQYIFNVSFSPVTTSAIRLVVRDTTYGGGATLQSVQGGGQTGLQGIQLAEVGIYGN